MLCSAKQAERHGISCKLRQGVSRLQGIWAFDKKRKPCAITQSDPEAQKAEDLIQWDFIADTPGMKWLADIKQMNCKDGKLYLCVVLDCFDASIVGFSMDTNMKTPLCTAALNSVIRRYGKSNGCILHSDQSSQFTSRLYRETLAAKGL